MSGRPQILLVGHDASRTGAPAAGLAWARWATAAGAADLAVWLDRGGDLVPAFAAVAPTQVGRGLRHRIGRDLLGPRRLPAAARALLDRAIRPAHPFDRPPSVVANTVAAWPTAAALTRRSRLTVWVHELDHMAERILPPGERERLLLQTDHVIAVGDRVAAMVRDRWRVPASRVTVAPSFTDPPVPPSPAASEPHPYDVVAVGSLTARKGPDAFVETIALLLGDRPDLRAAWIGGPLTSPTARLVRHQVAELPAPGIDLVGEVPSAAAWLGPDAVLVHTAREDADPLAVLEAAVRGMPVITWDTGGAADLLQKAGLGHLVAPAGDVVGLAGRVATLLGDPGARRSAGAALQAAARGRATDDIAPRILAAVAGAG